MGIVMIKLFCSVFAVSYLDSQTFPSTMNSVGLKSVTMIMGIVRRAKDAGRHVAQSISRGYIWLDMAFTE